MQKEIKSKKVTSTCNKQVFIKIKEEIKLRILKARTIKSKLPSLKNNIKFKRLIPLAIAIPILVSTSVFGINATKAYKVSIDNRDVCIVKDTNCFEEMLGQIKAKSEIDYGVEVIVPNEITYESILFANKKVTKDDEIKTLLEQSITLNSNAFEIVVDDKCMGFVKDRLSAEEVLNKIKAPFIKEEDDINCFGFLEDVKITEKQIHIDELKCVDDIYASMAMQKYEVKTYTIESGDTISEIAEKFDLKVKDIEKANPDVIVDKISIGQQLSLAVPRYAVNVVKRDSKSYEENIPFDEKYEDDNDMYRGETKVKTPGVEGRKLVQAEVISINGIIETTDIIGEDIIEPPKESIVLRGTKERPRTLAYGEFIMPSRGSISSRFGKRYSSFHTGVDIAAPRGSANKAADGGIVTFTGWSGGYGNLVIINHENGYETYYAHNDSITCKKGQRVARGDKIGTVGSTGNATGPHLHFEVRVNGVPVDPLKYVR